MRKAVFAVNLLLMATAINAAPALHIDVFYGSNQHIINVKQAKSLASITQYDLTLPKRLEDKLSKGLPKDPKQAQREAQRRVMAGGSSLQREIEKAYTGTLRAAEYKITKLPAVVFNYGDDVIYGVNDLSQAIKLYREKK